MLICSDMIMYTIKIMKQHFVYCALIVSATWGCSSNEEVIERKPVPLTLSLPNNFPPPVYDLTHNPLTEEGVALGKMLFYDPQLSRDNTISCGSCHIQVAGFTHHGHDVSHGIEDKLGRRNSLPVQNLLWYSAFFWDGGVHDLDLVSLNPLTDPVEMDERPENVFRKISAQERYKTAFKNAFGSEEVTSTRFLQALSQFMVTMISANAPYDKFMRQEGYQLSGDELKGLTLFQEKCATCHATDLFTDMSFRNNGVSSASDLLRDGGREEITLNPQDRGKFKVPSLRNVAYTAPYMHNGRFNTLKEVLDFYDVGVHNSETLDPLLQNDGSQGIPLDEEEKKMIIAFLQTLTDNQFLSDRRFAEF